MVDGGVVRGFFGLIILKPHKKKYKKGPWNLLNRLNKKFCWNTGSTIMVQDEKCLLFFSQVSVLERLSVYPVH